MRPTIRAAAAVLLGGVMSCAVAADPTVGWRNDGTGRFPSATPPSEWSTSKNVLWKVALPGASYAAPVVAGDKVFVVSDPSDLRCVRASDGKVLWRTDHADIKAPPGSSRGGKGGGKGGMGGGRSAGNTAATPVCDGKHVGVVLGNGVVAVYSTEGKRVWGRYVESPRIGFGASASPLLVGGKLIVHLKDLVALDLETGKEVWRAELPAVHASPVATRLGTEDIIITPTGTLLRASDGKVVARGKFRTSQSSPIVDGDTLYISSSGSIEALALARDKQGEVTVTSLWKEDGSGAKHHCPSPVAHEGLLYGVTNSGFLDVLEGKTGKKVYRQRLPIGQVYSSITLAGGYLFVLDLQGKAVVFKPGRKFERVAVNDLEGTGSCPAFAGNHLYVRGRQNLYCVSTEAGKVKE